MALARYADQAWATQLADLAPQRRIATLVACTHLLAASARDDVIDIEAVAQLPKGLCQVGRSVHTAYDPIARSGHPAMFRARIEG